MLISPEIGLPLDP